MDEVEWSRLKAHELRARADENAVVIIPTAATEQHGPHLPVMVDTRIGLEVAVRAARKCAETRPVVVTPPIWLGISEHHMPFGGTLSADYDTFFAMLRCVITSVTRHGFQDIVISNSHGGNNLAIQVAADRFATEIGATIVAARYATEGAAEIGAILEDQPHIMHAGEGETSMMMALENELVDSSELRDLARDRGRGPLAAGKGAFRWRSYTAASDNGLTGNPGRASSEKGERLLEVAAQSIADLIMDPDTFAPAADKRGPDIKGVPFRN